MTKISENVFENTVQRGWALCLEQKQGNAHKSIVLKDLIPKEYRDIRGTYKITIEFEENK